MTNAPDVLAELQSWYLSQCNGKWEHQYGISISTIDNPGWSIVIDIADTSLQARAFEEVRIEGSGRGDWCTCKLNGNIFEAFCGADSLPEALSIFLHWARLR